MRVSVVVLALLAVPAWSQALDPDAIDPPTGAAFAELELGRDGGLTYRLGLSESDFLGTGIGGEVSLARTGTGRESRLLLERPFALGPGRLTLSGEGRDRAFEDDAFYFRTAGIRAGYGLPLGRATLGGAVFARMDEVSDVRPDASPILARDEGERRTLGTALTLRFDSRDNALVPRSGVLAAAGISAAAVSGGDDWRSAHLDFEGFAPLGRRGIGTLAVSGGRIEAPGGTVPVTERAFAGLAAPRGFTGARFGPTDGGTALGGNAYVFASLEARMPILRDRTQRLFVGAFVDAGSVWELDDTAGAIGPVDDGFELRSSAGLSLSYLTRFGRIEASVAEPLRALDTDETERVALRLEARF